MDMNFRGHVTRVVAVEEASQVGQARRVALSLADHIGFDEIDAGRVALAATELATNVLKHGGGGSIRLQVVQGRGGLGVELCTFNGGPTFVLASSLPDGVSTGGTQGLGLGAIQRQAVVLDAWSDARGTVVLARVYAERAPRGVDIAYGALRLPMRHEEHCGDAWHMTEREGHLALTLIDGLGHGLQASDAAEAGVDALETDGVMEPTAMIGRMHARMSGTRGGAAAVACVALDSGDLQFAGIGNISASVIDLAGTRGLASHPGIVGVQYRKAQAFHLHAPEGNLLLLHTDGLQARWSLRDYPGLFQRHPALVVAILQRDFDRGRDDVGIVAWRLGA